MFETLLRLASSDSKKEDGVVGHHFHVGSKNVKYVDQSMRYILPKMIEGKTVSVVQ